MARSTPTTLALPPFEGATRRLVVWCVLTFFLFALMALLAPAAASFLLSHLALTPRAVLHGEAWQLVTYIFMPVGLVGTLFAMLTLWFTGSMLEQSFGARWLFELFFTSAIGAAILASALSFTGLFHLSPTQIALGPYAGIFGLLVGIARFYGDQEFLLLFVLRIKAKYLVAIYILVNLAMLLTSRGAFTALLQLAGAVAGFLFIRLAPRRGLAFGLTERLYGMRNEYYRVKRRRAARKFEVYMKGQNREVHFDKDGRYVDPESHGEKRDPNDRSWMN